MTSKSRENQRIETVNRIQNSALVMFAEHGLSISIAKIAQHAGLSKQALMYHYPSKSKLLEAVILDIEQSSFTALSQFFALLLQQKTPQDTTKLEEIITQFVEQHLWAVLFLRLILENRESYLPISFRAHHLEIIEALEVRQRAGTIKQDIDVAATFTNMNTLLLTTLATAQIQTSISVALDIEPAVWLKRRIFAIFVMYRSTLFP